MAEHNINLTSAEWNVMECLWEHSRLTGGEVSKLMHERCGWSRSTTLTLLGRIESKGAAEGRTDNGKKVFYPLICREDAAIRETEDFLDRVYKGSLSMMVGSFTRKQSLSKEEIDELYSILKEMEANSDA